MPPSVFSDHCHPLDELVHTRDSPAIFVFKPDEARITPASAPRVLDQPDASFFGLIPFPLAAVVEAPIVGLSDLIEVDWLNLLLINGLDLVVNAVVLAFLDLIIL